MEGSRITVVGAGFVGTAQAIALADQGHDVTLVEKDPERVRGLAAGRAPFHEPGLEEALQDALDQGRLRITGAVDGADAAMVFLCVGTPSAEDGSCDTSMLEAAAAEAGRALTGRAPVFVVKSTVPPGTTRTVVLPVLAPLGRLGRDFGLAVNPEFLREGSALADAREPDRVVYGACDDLSAAALASLYDDAVCPVVATSPESAELAKYAANTFLATKVSLANEMARLAEAVGADVKDVLHAVGLDPRIGPEFLQPGAGYGGSCLPKDVGALVNAAAAAGITMHLPAAAARVNAEMPSHVASLTSAALGGLEGKRVAVLGWTFKPGTDDLRGTRALPLAHALQEAGATVVGFDPVAGARIHELIRDVETADDLAASLQGADAAIIHTAWPAFGDLPAEAARSGCRLIVDARRMLDPEDVPEGVRLVTLGFGTDPPAPTHLTAASTGGGA